MLYGVADTGLGKSDLHYGVGLGLNAILDQWVIKGILGTPIN